MPDESGEKTEEPTPRRREEAREQGQVPKSQDLTAGITLVGAVLLLAFLGPRMMSVMRALVATMLGRLDGPRAGNLAESIGMSLSLAAKMLLPLGLGIAAIAALAGLAQVGVMVTGQPLVPKFSKISPLKGSQNLFSMRGLVRLGMSVGKVVVVVGVATLSIHNDLPKMLALLMLEPPAVLAAASGLVWWMALKIAAALLLLGLIDFAYQRWQHEQDLRMSKQEVKEEMKRMEGDPLVKQRRTKVAKQLAMQRLSQDVPGADVVVSNPTHYAVALKYDGEKMNAPKVVAKGADYMAMRIRQIAQGNGVPVVERPPLARAMYNNVEVGDEIPPDMYAAVAEILAYVYRLSGRESA